MYTNRKKYKIQGKTSSHRDLLIRNLVVDLLKSRRVKTTPAKAKIVKSQFDRLVTYAKKDTNATRSKLDSFFASNERAIAKLYEIVKEEGIKERTSGYTRVYKTLPRRGDLASQAYILLVNYKLPEKKSKISKLLETQSTKKESKSIVKKVKSTVGIKDENKKVERKGRSTDSETKTRRISM